jgi:hypothetical protein
LQNPSLDKLQGNPIPHPPNSKESSEGEIFNLEIKQSQDRMNQEEDKFEAGKEVPSFDLM